MPTLHAVGTALANVPGRPAATAAALIAAALIAAALIAAALIAGLGFGGIVGAATGIAKNPF